MFFIKIVYAIGVIGLGYLLCFGIVNGEDRNAITSIATFFTLWVSLGGILVGAMSSWQEFKLLPEQTALTKVLKKTMKISGEDYVGSDTSSYKTPVTTSYFISFEFTDGTRKNFQVDVNCYNTLLENDTGILTYKENGASLLFVGFQRQV